MELSPCVISSLLGYIMLDIGYWKEKLLLVKTCKICQEKDLSHYRLVESQSVGKYLSRGYTLLILCVMPSSPNCKSN